MFVSIFSDLDINHNYARRTAIDVSSYDVIVS